MSHLSQPSLSRRDFLALSVAPVAVFASSQNIAAQTQLPAGELTSLTLKQAADLIKSRKVTSLELTQACLARIHKYEPTLNAFITVTAEKALAQAREADAEISKGKYRGPLHGIPIALKDNIDTAGVRTTAASALFIERIPADDAEVVRKLKMAGTVFLGKLNMDEFAMGGSSASTYFKPVHNPWAIDRVPSGSSGGSAVAVAAEFCFGALGTDTTGSIRGPAAVCGIVGLKPTNGRVSNRGVIPFSWTLDTVGPMCHTVEDAAILFQVVAGYDAADINSVDMPVPDYAPAMKGPLKQLRIGVPRQQFFDERDPEIIPLAEDAIAILEKLSSGTRDIELPPVMDVGPSLAQAEAFAYHAKWFARNPNLYQPAVRRYLERAAKASAHDYAASLHEVRRLRREVGKVFANVDVIVTPGRKRLPAKIEDIVKNLASDVIPPPDIGVSQQFSVFGLPAMSVPCGFTKAGIPVAIQIVGPHWGEARVLAVGHAFQQATEWHKRRPPLKAEPQTEL